MYKQDKNYMRNDPNFSLYDACVLQVFPTSMGHESNRHVNLMPADFSADQFLDFKTLFRRSMLTYSGTKADYLSLSKLVN